MKKAFKIPAYYFLLIVLVFISCDNNDEGTTLPVNTTINKIGIETGNPYASIDKSPMDIIYYPPNFPSERMNNNDIKNTLTARVIYSRPQKNGREIFADSTAATTYIQEYGKEWRLGANEATEIEFFKPVVIQGNKIAAGRYIIYCIPYPDKWLVRLNSNLFSWGLHMNPKKDIVQIELPVNKTTNNIEYFTMIFQKTATGANLLMAWGNIEVLLPVSFNE